MKSATQILQNDKLMRKWRRLTFCEGENWVRKPKRSRVFAGGKKCFAFHSFSRTFRLLKKKKNVLPSCWLLFVVVVFMRLGYVSYTENCPCRRYSRRTSSAESINLLCVVFVVLFLFVVVVVFSFQTNLLPSKQMNLSYALCGFS